MRIIKLNEVFDAIRDVRPTGMSMAGVVTLAFDPYSWVLLWKIHKLDEVDFDEIKAIHSHNPVTTQAFLGLANKLKLTVNVFQSDEDGKAHVFRFERGLLVRCEETHGKHTSWETREYNEFGQLTNRRHSSGLRQAYAYDANGKLIDVSCDKKTQGDIHKKTIAELSEDGTILEVSC